MRKSILIVLTLILALTVIAFPALAAESPKTITTSGEGIIKASPEVASIYMSVENHSKTAKEARDKNGASMNNVISQLKKLGITKEQIQSVSFTVYPTYDFSSAKNQNIVTGYQANSQIMVKTDKLNEIGTIVDTAVDAGVNNVQNIVYSVKDEEAWSLKALEKATLAAAKKAKIVASALGTPLKGVQSFNEQGSYVRTFDLGVNYSKSARMDANQSTPIQTPEFIEIRANVTISYAI